MCEYLLWTWFASWKTYLCQGGKVYLAQNCSKKNSLINIVSGISRVCLLGWMIIHVRHIQVKKNITWIWDAGCYLQQIPCILLLSCLRAEVNVKRYDNEKAYLNLEFIFYLIGLDNEMMQRYGSTAKLLSDFEILNQVCSSSLCCLELVLFP